MTQQRSIQELYQASEFNSCASAIKKILSEDRGKIPDDKKIVLNNLLGVCLSELSMFSEAKDAYLKALDYRPNNSEVLNNLGQLYKSNFDLELAILYFKSALKHSKNFYQAHSNIAITFLEMKNYDEALYHGNLAVKLKPDFVIGHYNLGQIYAALNRFSKAETSFAAATELDPKFADAYNNLAITQYNQGDTHTAIKNWQTAIQIAPQLFFALNNLGVAMLERGDENLSADLFKRALKVNPNYCEAHRNLSSIKRYSEIDDQFHLMVELSKDLTLSKSDRCHLYFALAKAYEDLGRYEKAFDLYVDGNSLRKKILNYNITRDEQLFTKLTAYEIRGKIDHYLNSNDNNQKIIFIIGMPRSGTSLIEQIISAHRDVFGGGELNVLAQIALPLIQSKNIINEYDLMDCHARYVARIGKFKAKTQFITDKMPQNFRFVPIINSCFPGAKIVHVVRDPKATCWSNFKHFFVSETLGYSYSLKDVALYFEMYQKLMLHWKKLYPGMIIDVNYDTLTQSPKQEIPKLIYSLGLPWDENCLSPEKNRRRVRTASRLQVRNPIYKHSSMSWKRFEKYVGNSFVNLI